MADNPDAAEPIRYVRCPVCGLAVRLGADSLIPSRYYGGYSTAGECRASGIEVKEKSTDG